MLRAAAGGLGLDLVLDEGGGAFYGPKISVQARDAIGRTHQMSTIQLDFQNPQRFDMEYIGNDNGRHRPVMIHRALFGSIERFTAILLEHYAGALPTWLMPEQLVVVPVADDHEYYAASVVSAARAAGLRASVEGASSPLGARIRQAKLAKVPYVLVVGDEDVEARTVGVNARGSNSPERGVPLDAFIERVTSEVAAHGSPDAPA
jgi:threonyl-tRNA synthetase